MKAQDVLREARGIAEGLREAMQTLRDREAEVLERLAVYLAQISERLDTVEQAARELVKGNVQGHRAAQLLDALAPREDASVEKRKQLAAEVAAARDRLRGRAPTRPAHAHHPDPAGAEEVDAVGS